jgi:hypothetical protein
MRSHVTTQIFFPWRFFLEVVYSRPEWFSAAVFIFTEITCHENRLKDPMLLKFGCVAGQRSSIGPMVAALIRNPIKKLDKP